MRSRASLLGRRTALGVVKRMRNGAGLRDLHASHMLRGDLGRSVRYRPDLNSSVIVPTGSRQRQRKGGGGGG